MSVEAITAETSMPNVPRGAVSDSELGLQFTISARSKEPNVPILRFLAKNFPTTPIAQIDSIFGFVEASSLYGGRVFKQRELSDRDVAVLYDVGIGVRIPISNHFVEYREYEGNRSLFEKYHRNGNAVIVTNDELAGWIRNDFPKYRIEASVIKNINTAKKIRHYLDLFDTVVLPMPLCEDFDFLSKIENKERIRLFANAGCALTCPARICYKSVSRMNKFNGGDFRCSQPLKERELRGMVDFDIDHLIELGFRRFKLLRARPGAKTGF